MDGFAHGRMFLLDQEPSLIIAQVLSVVAVWLAFATP